MITSPYAALRPLHWLGDPPPADADPADATVICIDFIKPPDPADSPPRPHLEIVP